MARIAEEDPVGVRVRAEGLAYAYDYDEPPRSTAVYDGKSIRTIRYFERVLYVGDSANRMDRMVLLEPFFKNMIHPLRDPAQFQSYLDARVLSYEGQTYVGDVLCGVIYVQLKGARGQEPRFQLAIGAADRIPRRLEVWSERDGRAGAQVVSLHDVKLNVDIDESAFVLPTPEWFRETVFSLRVGAAAPGWTLRDDKNREHSLARLKGKLVILDFWATWCVPCRQVMATLEKIHRKYGDQRVAIFGVNVNEQDPEADAGAFFKEHGYTYGCLIGDAEMVKKYHVKGLPTLVVIDRDGKIRLRELGAHSDLAQRLEALIEANLESP